MSKYPFLCMQLPPILTVLWFSKVLHVTTNCEFLHTNILGSQAGIRFNELAIAGRLLVVLSLSSCSRQAPIYMDLSPDHTAQPSLPSGLAGRTFHSYRSNVPNLPMSLLHSASIFHYKHKHKHKTSGLHWKVMQLCTREIWRLLAGTRAILSRNAPINVIPHYPPTGQMMGIICRLKSKLNRIYQIPSDLPSGYTPV